MAVSTLAQPPPLTIAIESRRGLTALRLKELWAYRELLYFLTWRDIKVRYKQTVLGAAWAILQPVLTMIVFSVVFGRFGKIPSDGRPYPIFAFVALLPWQLFDYALNHSSQSLVTEARLITKVYFPRLIIPIASVLAGLVDFAIAFGVLLLLFLAYGVTLTWNILWLPLFLLLAIGSALAVGLWLSALNVVYRDVRYTVPFLAQLWMFLSPVAYPSSLIPPSWQWLYGLNPMVGVIEGFRWALLGSSPPAATMAISVLLTALFCIGGLYYFRSMERQFADLI